MADRAVFLAMGCALWLAACAVPVPPSGGPPDTAPPEVIETIPTSGAVLVSPDRVRIRFNEFINERTAVTSLSVTPAQERAPEIRAGGRTVEIIFREPLRDSTTYIISLDTGLQDAHGVALASPVRVAFSTGSRINRGRLSGTILRVRDGKPEAGMDVYAYRISERDSLWTLPSDPPDYRTQTDPDGGFAFDYLQETRYAVFGIRDLNRNRRADQGEAVAWPPQLAIQAASTSPDSGIWISARMDTTAPDLRRAVALSTRRIDLQFDEAVRLVDGNPRLWSLTDSSGGRTWSVLSVYQPLGQPRNVVLFAEAFGAGSLRLSGSGLADSTGNPAHISRISLSGSARPDTVRSRFAGFRLDTLTVASSQLWLRPGRDPVLAFSAPPDSAVLRGAIALSDTFGTALDWVARTETGTLVSIQPSGQYPVDLVLDLDALGLPDSTAGLRLFRVGSSRLGELSGAVSPSQGRIVVEGITTRTWTGTQLLTSEYPRIHRIETDSTGHFIFRGLPAGEVLRLRAFRDLNGNGQWDPGSLAPFSRPEPSGTLARTPPVRARWDTALADTLRLLLQDPRPIPAVRDSLLQQDPAPPDSTGN